MRWKGGRRSTNVEDRRGSSGGGGFGLPGGFGGGGRGGGGFRIPMGGKKGGGCGCLGIVVILAIALLTDFPILELLGGGGGAPQTQTQPATPGQQTEASDFVYVVLADIEDVWNEIFAEESQDFPEPTVVLFSQSTRSGCGMASASMGPFYCPADNKVYLDLSFLDQMKQLGAPGDFAFAYVIAHEVAHHIQHVTGIEPRMRELQRRDPRRQNEFSVRLELQADCLAGVWGNRTQSEGFVALEAGDIEEGLRAAAAIGDDRLQEQAGRRANPESFTHGTSEQRATWLRRGLSTGDPDQCDTFEGLM